MFPSQVKILFTPSPLLLNFCAVQGYSVTLVLVEPIIGVSRIILIINLECKYCLNIDYYKVYCWLFEWQQKPMPTHAQRTSIAVTTRQITFGLVELTDRFSLSSPHTWR